MSCHIPRVQGEELDSLMRLDNELADRVKSQVESKGYATSKPSRTTKISRGIQSTLSEGEPFLTSSISNSPESILEPVINSVDVAILQRVDILHHCTGISSFLPKSFCGINIPRGARKLRLLSDIALREHVPVLLNGTSLSGLKEVPHGYARRHVTGRPDKSIYRTENMVVSLISDGRGSVLKTFPTNTLGSTT